MAKVITIGGHAGISYLIPDPVYFKMIGAGSINTNVLDHSGAAGIPLNIPNETVLTAQLYGSEELKSAVLILIKHPYMPDAICTFVFGASIFDAISEENVHAIIESAMNATDGHKEELRWQEVTRFLNQLSQG